jgi:hypothetical protein
MLKLSGKKLKVLFVILFSTLVVYARITGPDPGYTGAPGDIGNCTACHNDPIELPNVGPGSITIAGAPAPYLPGQQYQLTVTVQQGGNREDFGFQLTAIDLAGNRAGTLQSLGSDTQVLSATGPGGRQYIEHTTQGTIPTQPGRGSWIIRWTAPDTDIGTVRFFAAGNAGDGGSNLFDDFIYTTNAISESPTSTVTLALASPPDGQTLAAGSHFTINWTTTGVSSIDNIEVRYSTDDGATFPINNQIFFTTNPAINSTDWIVPNTPTTLARIRVGVGTKAGTGIQRMSGRFTITGGSQVVLPEITSASVSGKKLIVSGLNFGFGCTLLMDGAKQKKTTNDETNPTTLLLAKKSGKLIDRGQTVSLQVRNPDGALSVPFSFMRPFE